MKKIIYLLVALLISSVLAGVNAEETLTVGWDDMVSHAVEIYISNVTVINYTQYNVNSSQFWDHLNNPSDINAGDITDDNTYVQINGDTMTGDLRIKDSDGEYHNISRDLQISDEISRNITLTGLNGTLGSDGNLTITTLSGENIVVNIDKNESILNRNIDSIIITSGTNGSPILNQIIYTNAANPVLAKRTSLSLKSPSVAAFLQGANFTYASAVGLATTDNLIGGLFNRFFRDGSTYRSGFDINVSTNMVNISTGVISFLFSEIKIIQNHSTSGLHAHVHENGSFHQHFIIDDDNSYNDGTAIGNNKYFNAVFGIAITHDGAGVMYTITQDKPTTEYTRVIDAEIDIEDTINYFPSNEIVSLAFIPVVRVVIRRSGGVNTIQTLSNGLLFDDLRGTITKTSSSPPPSGITSHSDLTNLDFASAGHTGFASTLELDNGSIVRSYNTSWINENEINIHDLNLSDNLISWWRMDDLNSSGGVINFITTGENGTINANAVQTNGILGKGFDFDGNSDYVDIPDNPNVDSDLNNSFTFSLWYKAESQPIASRFLFSKFYGGASLEGYYAAITPTIFQFRIDQSTCSGATVPVAQYSEHTVWTNAVMTYNQTHLGIYLQGILLNSTVYSGGVCDDTSTMRIGNHQTGITTLGFDGIIDDFRIYNRSLSQDEITQLYELGDLDATTQLDIAHFKEYISSASAYFGNLVAGTMNIIELTLGSLSVMGESEFDGPVGIIANLLTFSLSGTGIYFSASDITIQAVSGDLTIDDDGAGGEVKIDMDLLVTGDLETLGKVDYGDIDPETIQYKHTSRQETIDKYKNWACEGVAQTVRFFNIDTGREEFYYPLTGEFKDPYNDYHILEKIEPQYNSNCTTKYKWNYIYGDSTEQKQSSKDYKVRIQDGMILNRTTGQLQETK